jgi:hypothetical protein
MGRTDHASYDHAEQNDTSPPGIAPLENPPETRPAKALDQTPG